MAIALGLPIAPAARAAASPDTIAVPPGDDEPYFFYHGRRYGSEALVHPLRMVVNGSYGILQLDNRDKRPGSIDYEQGIDNVWRNLAHPLTSIRVHGWKDFFRNEILPVSVNARDARYWPNYTQHLIGGGMSYRMIAEWYRRHEVPHPRAMSALSMAVYHAWNEVVENDTLSAWTTDPIADLYLFDPLGIVLFNFDTAPRFFSETLHMADWSYQPTWDPARGTLDNNGQNFALKLAIPRTRSWSLFYHYGTHGELGLSRAFDDGTSWSFAAGFKASNLVDLGAGTRTVDLVPSGGLFYDRNHSLLASLLFARTKGYRVRLNLYPGLVRVGGFSPGWFVAVDHEDRVLAGITLADVPHLPLGLATRF